MSFNAENTLSLAVEETGAAKMRAATVKSEASVFLRSYRNFITVQSSSICFRLILGLVPNCTRFYKQTSWRERRSTRAESAHYIKSNDRFIPRT